MAFQGSCLDAMHAASGRFSHLARFHCKRCNGTKFNQSSSGRPKIGANKGYCQVIQRSKLPHLLITSDCKAIKHCHRPRPG
uniref:Uncharacterized protein n=1 Tax=Triticum urartu TaxID=4572 RepID=A0A8R7R3G0_TRIUA